MMKTKIYKLGDITKNISDGVHNTVIDDPNGECFLLSAKNIKNGIVSYDYTDRRISKEIRIKLNKRTKMEPGDVAITTVGTIGELAVLKNNCVDFEFQRSVGIIKTDEKILYPIFLFYILKDSSYQNYFKALAIGAAQQCIFLKTLKSLKVQIPNLYIQVKIANVLSKYDELIGNNNQRIKLLEQMAEELYKEWFVRFRFSEYQKIKFKDSKLGKIPESFETINVYKVLDYFVGGGWGNDNPSDEFPIDAYVIRGADFPEISKSDTSTCPYRFHKISNYKPRKLKENDIVFEISGGTQEQPVGRVVLVTKGILDQLDDKAICASFCKLLRVNESVTPLYFYYWLKYLYDTRIIEQFQLQSTGIINFKFEYFLRKGPVLLPPYSLMEDFDRRIKLIRDEIDSLAKSNSNLIKQRDSLLPRLMSGKLSVEGKEIV